MPETNLLFYQKLNLDKFKYFAEVLGLDSAEDIEFIYPRIKDSKAVIELGSGYGRVIDKLIELGFSGKISGIERISYLVEYLRNKYNHEVEIVETDIRNLARPEKVDTILWMWSGILELNKSEQAKAVANLFHCLEVGGTLVVETPYQTVHAVGKLGPDNKVKFETDWGTLEAYLCTEDELRKMAKKAGYSSFEAKTYRTTKDIERICYFLVR